ncbi:MAG: hypothetical protein WBF55_21990, partial [Syntrophobacteria bacterium]
MNSRPGVTGTTDMAVLPGVLGCRPLRRTVQVRLGPIPRYRGTVARWHNHLRGLATAIHKISGLNVIMSGKFWKCFSEMEGNTRYWSATV